MKTIFRIILSTILLLWIVQCITACETDPTAENPQEVIKKTWALGSTGYVKKDGTTVTSEYTGMNITFKTDGTYTTTGAKKLFYPSGTWAWKGTGTSEITLYQNNGDLPVTVKEISASVLRVEFNMQVEDVNPNGRATAVVGSYEILLNGN